MARLLADQHGVLERYLGDYAVGAVDYDLVADAYFLLEEEQDARYHVAHQLLHTETYRDSRRAAHEATGTPLANPFLALAFLPLPVIPEARLTLAGFTHV